MPGRVGKHKEAPLPALPQQQARVDSGLGGSAGTAPTGGLKRRDTLRNEPPPSKPPRQPVAALQATNERAPSALTQKFPFLARLAGTAHEWKPEQRFVLAIGGDDPKILNSAQVKAFDRQVPDGNRFRAEARGEFGQQLGAASLERLDLSSRLDISAHGNNDAVVPDQESAAQLARRLHDSGLREVGVLKIEASKIGERDYLDKLKAELDALGVKVGYLSAPKDFFANFKTYERGTNGRERVFKEIPLLPGKAIGGAFSPETFGLKVLKGNVDIAFPGTRYDLAAPREAGLQPTAAAAQGNADKPLPSAPASPKRRPVGAKLGKLLGKAQQKVQTAGKDLAGMTQHVRGEIKQNAKEFKEVAKEFSRHLRDGVPASNNELAAIKADLKKDFGDFKAKLKARVVGAPPDHVSDLASTLAPEVVQEYNRLNLRITPDTMPAFTDGDLARTAFKLASGGFNTVYAVKLKVSEEVRLDRVFKPLGTKEKAWVAKSTGIALDNPQTAMRNIATVAYAKALDFGVVPDTQVALLTMPVRNGGASAGPPEPALGLVMEKAAGRDAKHMPSHVLADAEVAREVTKLQLLDHLTGQGDRHNSNYFISVGPGEKVKVTGIDNDLSFGRKLHDPEGIRYRGGWGGFKGTLLPPVVDEDMEEAIKALKPKHLEAMLGDKLSDQEIEAATDRLEAVQAHIANLRHNGLVVPANQWNTPLLNKYMNPGNSYAARDYFAAWHKEQAALKAQQAAQQPLQVLQQAPQQVQQAHPAQQVPW